MNNPYGDIPTIIIREENFIAYMDKTLEYASLDVITRRLEPAYRKHRSIITKKYGQEPLELRAYGERLRYKKESLSRHAGTVPAPNVLVSSELTTREFLLQFNPEEEYIYMNAEAPDNQENKTGKALAAESNSALEKIESGYILDAFYKYIAAYFDGRPLPLELPEGSFTLEGDYYVLKDTFSSFCKNAGIEQGDMRRRVKAALFPEEGKTGLLEYVRFYGEKEGKKYCLEKRFISRRATLKVKTGRTNLLPNAPEYEPEAFVLDIDADLFYFLEQRNAIKTGTAKGKVGGGWLAIPAALNMKIESTIKRLLLTEAVRPGYFPGANELQRSPERFRLPVEYIIRRWTAGQATRKNTLIIEHAELMERGLIAKHSKNKSRKIRDMHAIHAICFDLWAQKEAFHGCSATKIQENGVILFEL